MDENVAQSAASAFKRQIGGMPAGPQAERALSRALWSIEAVALALYFIRDAFAGAMRYYLNVMRLDPLWFIPDLLAIVTMGVFVYRYCLRGRSILATMLVFYTGIALILGYVFLGTFAGMSSAFKMFAPIFVGFCFCQRNIDDTPWLMPLIRVLFFSSIFGVVASKFIKFPWVGFSYESFGATREAGRLWWSQSEVRLSGFAADSTMASFFILITFVFCSARAKLWWIIVWGAVAIATVRLTTNKTALGVLCIYMLALLFVRFLPEIQRFRALRMLALGSFGCILIPIALIVVFSGTDVTMASSWFSLMDRVNNSWQKPFIYMEKIMPIGFITGCGLGCFNYPQQLFSPETRQYFMPVDNFYIGTYLMFGPIFLVFMIFVIKSLRETINIDKLTICFVMNVYTVTVLAYGPASGLLMLGFAFSEVFAPPKGRYFTAGTTMRLPARSTAGPMSLRPAE